MNTNIKGTMTLTPAISEYVDKRLDKIAKMLGGEPSIQCDVELSRTSSHHNKGDIFKAEIHIVGAGKDLFASAEEPDLYTAIDIVRDEIMRELKSKKGKHLSFIRRGGSQVKAMMKGMMPWGK